MRLVHRYFSNLLYLMLKKLLQRRQYSFLLGSYLLISAVPFFPLMLGRPVEHANLIVALELFFWLLLWSLFKRPRNFHWLLLPVFLALPIEIYLQIFFMQGISPHHLGLVIETSPKEAVEFLGKKTLLLILIETAILGWWYFVNRAGKSILVWTHASRWLGLAICLCCIALFVYGEEFGYQQARHSVLANAADDGNDDEASTTTPTPTRFHELTSAFQGKVPSLPSWFETPVDKKIVARTWPFGFAVNVADFLYERHYLSVLAEKSSAFTFGATSDTTPKTIVVIIGESSRFDRWSLNGYGRDTTPLLKSEANLVALSDIISPVAATRLSVPVIVSRKPAMQSLKAGFSEKSFLSAFKEAGFKTYWISNQMSFGEFDTPVSVFAKEADVTEFLNLGGFTNSSSLDQVMLDPLERALRDASLKKLIVLHSIGNHWNYSHRHAPEFNRWTPSLTGETDPDYDDRAIKEQMNNSYDNSVLYTDWFLTQAIHKLKAQNIISALIYVSDHGQTLYDGACELAFHGHNTQYEFHIPAFLWYSNDYAEQFPDKVAQLKQHRHAKLSTENIFHSVLDVADVHYPSEQLERSIVSAKLTAHKRYVDSYGWTNYDDAHLQGDCHEVIDNHKPLPRDE